MEDISDRRAKTGMELSLRETPQSVSVITRQRMDDQEMESPGAVVGQMRSDHNIQILPTRFGNRATGRGRVALQQGHYSRVLLGLIVSQRLYRKILGRMSLLKPDGRAHHGGGCTDRHKAPGTGKAAQRTNPSTSDQVHGTQNPGQTQHACPQYG